MNDEINHEVATKTVALTFRAARLTKDVLAKAMRAYLESHKKHKAVEEPKHGKMKLTELVGQGQGASSIEVTDNNIRAFEKIAKKYNVDFAVKKDKTMNPPKYMVFFKAKDTDVLSQAFKEFVKVNEKQKAKVSVRHKIKNFAKQVAQNKNRERTRDKQKSKDQSL